MVPFDDIPSLRAFVAIAEHGTFSKAAESLHITQPAISKRIALLEENLGEKLFDRLGRKIILTETGRAILPRCKDILKTINDAQLMVDNLDGKIEGSLRLGTSHHIGLHHLPPVIREFGLRYSSVELELHFMSSEQVCEKVAQAELDMGIVTLPLPPPDTLIAKPIWQDELFFVAGKDHDLCQQETPSLHSLTQYNSILPEKETYTFKIIENFFLENNLALTTKLSTNFLETIKMMVSVGLGWSVLPKTMIDEDLTILTIPNFQLTRNLGYIQRKQRTTSNATLAMMTLLNEIKNSA